ncbi:MAG TPA: sigma-70 family RNA polymerase sigma factor [Blastocatellia bacterium]|nr:sigma-70 family RNA polymerase sigma factor [Blastocatellia bacterium]
MLKPWTIIPNHEDLFIQRYDHILSWSLKITGHNRQLAEDLVHDAFIQFVLVRPDLSEINNLEGYIYRMLRNMYLSHLRRASRGPAGPVSPVDYDSAEIILRAADAQSSVSARQELAIICHYACVRKETSRAGSVLILRFFHGYLPGEIALILQTSRQAVAELLRVARQEARLSLDQPRRLSFMREARTDLLSGSLFKRSQPDFLNDLRSAIFRSRHNSCVPAEQLEKFYSSEAPETINALTLGHVVSCPRCLDAVNSLLDLPRLSDRYPTDTLGPDTRSSGGRRGSGDRPSPPSINTYRRRLTEMLEHSPKELRVSVNGFILGSQRVSSDLNELSLSIKDVEKIDFVEVFSEQGIRLFFCNVDAPPEGQFEQRASIRLSEGRNLDVCLSFCGPWPNLNVSYHDPQLKPAQYAQPRQWSSEPPAKEKRETAAPEKLRHLLDPLIAGLATVRSWMRPATVTLVLTMLLITAVVLFKSRLTPVSAAELLRRATVTEAAAVPPEIVSHRTISLEERRAMDSALINRRRIEIWQDGGKRVKARRVYDERGQLVAGEWTNPDGSQTLYSRGARPEPASAIESQAAILEEVYRAWRFEPSAKLFATLVGNIEAATVSVGAASYVIEYRGEEMSGGVRLIRASLTINRTDLRTIEQTIVIGHAGGEREYRFRESGFERLPAGRVAPAIFTPDRELTGTLSGRSALPLDKAVPDADASPSAVAAPLGLLAMAEIEIEAEYRLHRLGACLREQALITRTAEGGLKIQTVVASEGRKAQMLEALGPLAANAAVRVQIETVAEAIQNQSKLPPAPAVASRVQITGDRIPLYAELQRYFYERSTGGKTGEASPPPDGRFDQDIRRLANRLLKYSRQALLHAWALRRLAGQFSAEELQGMGGEANSKWLAMVREHAARFSEETASLRTELRPVFFAGANTGAGLQPGEGAGLHQSIETLFQFASAHEEAVRMSFTISDGQPRASVIRTEQFWNSLLGAERLARRIQSEN